MKTKVKVIVIAFVELMVAVSLYIIVMPLLLRFGFQISMESWVGICIVVVMAHFAKMYREAEGKSRTSNQ